MASLIQKHELEIDEDSISCPERDLWVAVLARAALDAFRGPPHLDMNLSCNISHKNVYNYNRDRARYFFLEGGDHFREVCEMAGRDATYIRETARKILLRKNGWNVDVPMTAHYRKSQKIKRKRGPQKKHLSGNSYYAAKAAGNL